MEIVIMRLTPFSLVTNPFMRKHSAHAKLSVNTFMKYLQLMTHHVEKNVSKALPDRFALLFDGWSAKETHYVAIYATYPSLARCLFDKVLLAFAPLGTEEKLDATHHC